MFNEKDGEQSPSYTPIEIETYPAVPVEELETNIRVNASLGIPFLLDRKFELRDEPIAIVGGGPSLKQTMGALREFKQVMVCGTAHDHLVSNGIKPTYSVFCDQGPDLHAFRQKLQSDCTYLLATQCDQSLVNHLMDCDLLLWDIEGWVDEKVFSGRPRIAGGSTAAMRALSLAQVLGFRDLHIFGVDSSFEDNRDRHAYDYEDEREASPALMCRLNGRTFRTSLPFLAQAQDFQYILQNYGHLFSATVHGDSLLGDVWKDLKNKHDAVFNQRKAA